MDTFVNRLNAVADGQLNWIPGGLNRDRTGFVVAPTTYLPPPLPPTTPADATARATGLQTLPAAGAQGAAAGHACAQSS